MTETNKNISNDIESIVYQAVAEASGSDIEELTEYTELITTLNMDSLAIFELAIELEDKFNLRIPDEDIDEIITIGDAVRYLNEKTK